MRYLGFIIAILTLSSCLKEELPVPKKDFGEAEIVVVDIGNDYPYQAFFSLSTGEIVSKNEKEDWDFGFGKDNNGEPAIIINYSRNMFVYPTEKENMSDLLSPAGYINPNDQRFDSPYGEYDSLAMRHYEDGLVRLIDMGYGLDGNHMGWAKIRIAGVENGSFTVEYAPINATEFSTKVISPTANHQFTYFNIRTGLEAEIAPPDDSWDFIFTQFSQRLYEPLVMPYLVTGTLFNRQNVRGKRLEFVDYDGIDFEYAQSLILSDTMNIIGYDWKSFDFGSEDYTVYDYICYVIQDREGTLYKLKFLDFYAPNGEKGYNKFMYQKLG